MLFSKTGKNKYVRKTIDRTVDGYYIWNFKTLASL